MLRSFFQEKIMIRLHRVLFAVVSVGLLAVPASLRADPKYLPSDTSAVLIINFKQILNSDLVKGQKDGIDELKKAIEGQGGPDAAAALKYLKDAGFDPLKDLHTLIAGSPNPRDTESGFLIIRGNFDVDKIQGIAAQAVKDNGDALKITKSGDINVYEISPAGGANTFYAAFVNKDTMIAGGSKDGLKEGIARVNGTKKATHKAEFKELLKTISDKQSISFAISGDALGELKNNPAVPFADSVQGITGFLTLGKTVQFQAGVHTKDAQSAQQLTAVMTGLLELGKNAVNQKAKDDERAAPVVDIMKTLKLSSQGNQMVLRGEITLDTLEKLKKLVPGN
jgi:hypothetical protein